MPKKIRLLIFTVILTFAATQMAFAGFPAVYNKDSSASRPKYEIYTPQLSGVQNGEAQSIINKTLTIMPEEMLKEYQQATRYIGKEIKNNNRDTDLINALVLLVDYDVKLLSKNTLSIVQQGYMYSGGAHGITSTIAKTFNLKTGHMYQLSDLFDSDEYVQNINTIIRREINERGKQNVYQFTGLQNNQSFYLSREGLFLFFQQYEIAPYSEGIITFYIPYSQLKDFKSEILNRQ